MRRKRHSRRTPARGVPRRDARLDLTPVGCALTGVALALLANPAVADSTDAACAVYAAGSGQVEGLLRCRFYQAQGHVVITRSDSVEHDLVPLGDAPGNFRDQNGRTVYRQSDLGDQGLIFRFPDESVYVYWNTALLDPADPDDSTWPFTAQDYDATALFTCRLPDDREDRSCPGGILRMEGGEASIVVQNPSGERFTINFMRDYVNATNRAVEARLVGDTWILDFENGEYWEVPLAAIEGR